MTPHSNPALADVAWAEVPRPPLPAPRRAPLAWAIVAIPMVLGLRLELEPVALGVLVVAVAAEVAVLRFVAPIWSSLLAVSAIAVLTSVAVGPGVALAAALLSAGWTVLLGVRQVAGGASNLRPMAGPLAVSVLLLLLRGPIWLVVTMGFLALAITILAASAPSVAGRIVVIGDRIGGYVGTCVGAVVMLVPAAVITVLWAAYRIFGHDPLQTARRGWTKRPERGWPVVGRSHDPAAALALSGASRRRRRVAHLAVGVVGVLALVALLTWPVSAPESAAFAHDPEWQQVWRQQQEFNSNPRFDNTTLWRLEDFQSEYVNQLDGARSTWTPPPCTCRRYTVWWFGGSAAWGFFQRDSDTIPSQLARDAWDQGIALDIVNLAVPGHTLAQEAQLFAQRSVTLPAPDLAIFYDGANELFLQAERNVQGDGGDESPASYADDTLSTVIQTASLPQRLWSWLTPGSVRPEGARSNTQLDAPEVALHAMNRYRRQVHLVEAAAAAQDIDVMFAWQPTSSTASSAAIAEFEPMDPEDAQWHRRLVAAARRQLPSNTVDLSDVVADLDVPVFPDWAHTNEIGSDKVAYALLAELEHRWPTGG